MSSPVLHIIFNLNKPEGKTRDTVRKRLNPAAPAMNCPHCDRLLYSRRHKKCGFCGGELPTEVLFTEAEIAAIQREQQEIEMRRAKAKVQEEERLEEERRTNSADGGYGMGPLDF